MNANPITAFRLEYAFLSNFYLQPIFVFDHVFKTSEHAFQAMKMVNKENFDKVDKCATPGQAKRVARSLPRREDWGQIKDGIMLQCLRSKFSNPLLGNKLLATGDRELIEGNTWGDTYWGVCKGEGQNKLGKLLMQVREEIRNA